MRLGVKHGIIRYLLIEEVKEDTEEEEEKKEKTKLTENGQNRLIRSFVLLS